MLLKDTPQVLEPPVVAGKTRPVLLDQFFYDNKIVQHFTIATKKGKNESWR